MCKVAISAIIIKLKAEYNALVYFCCLQIIYYVLFILLMRYIHVWITYWYEFSTFQKFSECTGIMLINHVHPFIGITTMLLDYTYMSTMYEHTIWFSVPFILSSVDCKIICDRVRQNRAYARKIHFEIWAFKSVTVQTIKFQIFT